MTIDGRHGSRSLVVACARADRPADCSDRDFFVDFVMTRALILGLAASTIVFLSALRRDGVAGPIAARRRGRVHGRQLRGRGGTKGLKLGLESVGRGRGRARRHHVLVALVLGALASRTTGIYFLMLTLTYAVIGYYFFGQVTTLSGFGGITGIDPPPLLRRAPGAALLRRARAVGASPTSGSGRSPHAVRAGAAGGPRRPGADGVARLQCSAASHAGVHAGRIRRRRRRRAEHLVERPDRPDLDLDRRHARPAHHRCHRRHRLPRGRLARRPGVRRGQQLPARPSARRPDRPHGGAIQHRRRAARAADRGALARGAHGHRRPDFDVVAAGADASARCHRETVETGCRNTS